MAIKKASVSGASQPMFSLVISQVKQPVALFQQAPTNGSARPAPVNHRLEVAPQMYHPNAIAELRGTIVIPYTSTARPYVPRQPRRP